MRRKKMQWNISNFGGDKEIVVNEPDNEAFVNAVLMDRLDTIQNFDPEVGRKIMDDMHHSELARIFENADERDILTVCYIAVRRFPVKYLTVLMDYILEKEGSHV